MNLATQVASGWGSISESAWNAILRKVEELHGLRAGWDGEDAEAPSVELLESSIALLANLREASAPVPSRVVPTLEGGLVIEWHQVDRYMEIEIEEPYRAEVMDSSNGAPIEHYEFSWSQPGRPRFAGANWSDGNEFAMTA